jgi:hypothetical protein
MFLICSSLHLFPGVEYQDTRGEESAPHSTSSLVWNTRIQEVKNLLLTPPLPWCGIPGYKR